MSGPENKTLEAAGFEWEYVWAKPVGEVQGLIFALHGAGGNGKQFGADSGWISSANHAGFAIALPTGLAALPRRTGNPTQNPNIWNSGELNSRGPRAQVDDLKFFDTLLKECQKEIGEVPIFVTGFSNGAGMSFKLASHWKNKIRGLGIMAGDLKCELGKKPESPIPSLIFAGEKDEMLLWEGGTVDLPWGSVKRKTEPVLEIAMTWARWMGIESKPEKIKGDGLQTYKFSEYVHLVMIEGQGHVWPGGEMGRLSARKLGQDSGKVDATAEFTMFFTKQLDDK